MAFTGMAAQRDGWRLQAEHLAITHTAAGFAAATLARQVRRLPAQKRPSRLEENDFEAANELERLRAKLAERDTALARAERRTAFLTRRVTQLERQVAREIAVARTPDEDVETFAEKAAAVARPAAEPNDELSAARDELVLLENKNHSLQMSLDLMVSENARLSGCLTASDSAIESGRSEFARMKTALDWFVSENSRLSQRLTECDGATDTARSQLAQMRAALAASDAERDKLVAGTDVADARHQTESRMLNIRLEAMSARAVTTEKLLVNAVKCMLMRIEETRIAERDVADARAREAFDEEREPLLNSLQIKERQVQELAQSRSELIEAAKTLLKTLETRDTALARAQIRIKLLGEQFEQLEAKAKPINTKQEADGPDAQPKGERVKHTGAERTVKKVRNNAGKTCAALSSEAARFVTPDRRNANGIRAHSKGILADTITF
jgi:chromosome segregation ATPase